jgi:hypothetical protein
MAKPLTIQNKDAERIQMLMKALHISKQIDVVRAGLDLLEQEAARQKRVARWAEATKAVSKQSKQINKEFQTHSRLHKI